jgi:hypothetical protein
MQNIKKTRLAVFDIKRESIFNELYINNKSLFVQVIDILKVLKGTRYLVVDYDNKRKDKMLLLNK